ncbi:hypothetical protein ILYODFUR_010004 [Ilyodon furcidens]|uniref:Uncharacterized protein n=1 Tax=Ilyodon furcidens TaxID=33524 RepID=A0ABV0T836_9TELE
MSVTWFKREHVCPRSCQTPSTPTPHRHSTLSALRPLSLSHIPHSALPTFKTPQIATAITAYMQPSCPLIPLRFCTYSLSYPTRVSVDIQGLDNETETPGFRPQ